VLGIGGGGDVVGALATARLLERLGVRVRLGGVAWERLPIDPHPGPRAIAEIIDGEQIAEHAVLARPETHTPAGAIFAEANMARFLGEQTVLLDILQGPARVAATLREVADRLSVDVLVFVDVGGDVLANGSEPGLASPLCDAVMLAAAARLEREGAATIAGIFGPCCDGELSVEEILDRLSRVAAAGGLLGAVGMTPDVTGELERATETIPTEASAQAIRCARGEIGYTTIRRGRRKVPLTPLGALTFYFDPIRAVESTAELAHAVFDARDLEHANDVLHAHGVPTELDYERKQLEA
jgi:hypothetical protein